MPGPQLPGNGAQGGRKRNTLANMQSHQKVRGMPVLSIEIDSFKFKTHVERMKNPNAKSNTPDETVSLIVPELSFAPLPMEPATVELLRIGVRPCNNCCGLIFKRPMA